MAFITQYRAESLSAELMYSWGFVIILLLMTYECQPDKVQGSHLPALVGNKIITFMQHAVSLFIQQNHPLL